MYPMMFGLELAARRRADPEWCSVDSYRQSLKTFLFSHQY